MSEPGNKQTGRLEREESKLGWLDLVNDQVKSLRFGTVLITVHEGRVVQVEKNEKLRLDQTTVVPARTGTRG